MKFQAHRSTNGSQWNTYQQLELIPSVANPANRTNYLTTKLNALWRPLLALLMDELVEEQQVEYLERCLSLNELGKGQSSCNSLKRFWTLIN